MANNACLYIYIYFILTISKYALCDIGGGDDDDGDSDGGNVICIAYNKRIRKIAETTTMINKNIVYKFVKLNLACVASIKLINSIEIIIAKYLFSCKRCEIESY